MEAARRVVLVRYGEVGLKGLNRPAFERALGRRLQGSLAGLPGTTVRRRWGRMVVDAPPEGLRPALARVTRVFGVASASPALEVPPRWEAIEEGALLVARETLERRGAEKATFKVDANRADKGFPLTSPEINRRLGAFLLERLPGLRVSLEEPDVTVAVDVREEAVYLHAETVPGPGGLPVGVSGRGMLLLSGGIDSPVAGWRMMKRGLEVEAVHFHSPPFTGEQARDKVVDLCRVLAGWGGVGGLTLHLVRFTEVQTTVYERCPARLGVLVLRRFMVRVAEALARRRGALALVTGESLGQVASQTLESLAVIGAAAGLPILRPLVGADKEETVALARAIGTYPVSIRPYEDCCTVFVARHPVTRPRLADVEEAEAALPVDELVAAALAAAEVLEVAASRATQVL